MIPKYFSNRDKILTKDIGVDFCKAIVAYLGRLFSERYLDQSFPSIKVTCPKRLYHFLM